MPGFLISSCPSPSGRMKNDVTEKFSQRPYRSCMLRPRCCSAPLPTWTLPIMEKPEELFTSEFSWYSSPRPKPDITTQVNRQFLRQGFHLKIGSFKGCTKARHPVRSFIRGNAHLFCKYLITIAPGSAWLFRKAAEKKALVNNLATSPISH